MNYDWIRVGFSSILLALGVGLILIDFRRSSDEKNKVPRQTLKFGNIEVSTTSLGLAILVLATPVLLLSRISIDQAELKSRRDFLTPLLNAYQSAINEYYDTQVKFVQNWIDNEYLPKYLENFRKEISKSPHGTDETEFLRASIASVRKKERELISQLEKDKLELLRSANDYVTKTLEGDPQSSLRTLDETIDAKRKIAINQVKDFTEALMKIVPHLVTP